MSKGYVYILSNPSMPGLVKIGKTTRDVNQRADELYQTGVPTPFKVEHVVCAPDCDDLERYVHLSLSDKRVSPSREFFEHDLDMVIDILKSCHREQVEEWVSEFIPNEVLVEAEFFLDPSFPSILATHSDLHPFEVVEAYGYLTPEEIEPAVKRMKDHMSGAKKMEWVRPAENQKGETLQ